MLLTSCRVLDLTGPLGSIAGRILADLGADVIKIEPPGGDPARAMPPVLEDESGAHVGLAWLAANANKRSVTLDLASAGGRADLVRLARTSDFLLESELPGHLDALGLGYGSLAGVNPSLVYVSITPYGQQEPYRRFIGSDIEIMAMGGAMWLAGDADGEPTRVTAPQAAMWVGAEAAMGALTAFVHRCATGRGQYVDVSAQEAVISALAHAPVFWDLTGANPKRAGIYITGRSVKGAKMRAFWPCKDGWINFIIYGGVAGLRTNVQLVDWMASVGMAPDWLRAIDWKKMDSTRFDQEQVDRLETPIAEFFLTLTKREFLEGAVAREMLGYPVSTAADIYADTQLEARHFWESLAVSPTRTLRFPGSFANIDGRRLPVRPRISRAGEHNEEVLGAPVSAER